MTGTHAPGSIVAVYAEESGLYSGRILISTVYAGGRVSEKHLSVAIARRYLATQRAKIGGSDHDRHTADDRRGSWGD